MGKNWKLIVAAVVVVITVGFGGWVAYSHYHSSQPQVDRVIFLGIDGISPTLLDPLVEQGKLPAVKRLMEQGCYGHMKTFRPTESGILWTSVATGKTMLKHGVIDWTYVKKAGLNVPYEDTERKVKTFWEILSERGIKTGTVNWWWTFPPPPIQNGYVVSDRYRLHTLLREPAPDTVYPTPLFDELKGLVMKRRKEILEEMKRQGIPEWKEETAPIPLGGSRKTLEAYPVYFAQDMTVDRASDYLWEHHPVPVFATYVRLIDVTCHFAWHWIDKDLYDHAVALENDGKLTDAERTRVDLAYAQVMAPIYQWMDRFIAKYLDRLDGRTALLICSDHGFHFSNGIYAHGEHSNIAPDGVVFAIGPGIKKGQRLPDAQLFDITPTILYLMNQPLAQDMDGTILKGAFEEDVLDNRPAQTIASFETVKRATGAASGDQEEMNKKLLEDLEALGYIQSSDQGSQPQPQGKPPAQADTPAKPKDKNEKR